MQQIAVYKYAQSVAGASSASRDITQLMAGDEGRAEDLAEGLLDNANVAARIVYLGGCMAQSDLAHFRRMIVRVSKGKVYVSSADLEVPSDDRLLDDVSFGQGTAIFLLAF